MSRTAWIFNNYSWPVNPESDTGWTTELVISNRVPIGGSRSRIQVGGLRSDVRQISGWIYGPQSQTHIQNMTNWIKNRVVATLTDHLGVSRQAMLVDFKPQLQVSPMEWRQGRQVYKYSATFLAMD